MWIFEAARSEIKRITGQERTVDGMKENLAVLDADAEGAVAGERPRDDPADVGDLR
jgi:hypothetical protein